MAKSSGIDYSGLDFRVNRNPESGIRYGIVHQHDLAEWFFEVVENEYDNFCPACGTELDENQADAVDPQGPCPHCAETIKRDETTGDEPSRTVFDSDGVKGFVDSSGDVWVCESPCVTRGTHCSPCAPGAVSVGKDSVGTDPDAPIAYTLPPSWFRDEKRPAPGSFFRADSGDLTVPYVEA